MRIRICIFSQTRTPNFLHDRMNSFPVELERVHKLIVEREATLASLPTTSNPAQIQKSLNELPTTLPATGIGLTGTALSLHLVRMRKDLF